MATRGRYFLQEKQKEAKVRRGRMWLKDADQTGEKNQYVDVQLQKNYKFLHYWVCVFSLGQGRIVCCE